MKKLLILSMVLICVPLCGVETQASAPDDHRSPLRFTQEIIPLKKGLLEKCLLAGKGLGAGAVSTLFGAFCYQHARLDFGGGSKDVEVLDRISSLCAAGAAFVCAAKLGSYSIKCAREILVD